MAMPVSDSFFNSSTAEYKIDGLELAGSVTPLDGLEIFAGATWLKAWAKGDDGKSTDKMPYTPSFALQAGSSGNSGSTFCSAATTSTCKMSTRAI